MDKIYDLIILGAGPAGLSAAIYAGRSRLDTLLLEQGQDGGQIALTDRIDNYPGQLEGDSGASLIARMASQAEKAGVRRLRDTVRSVELGDTVKKLTGRNGDYLARTVILACGAAPRPIGCKNEEDYVGRGISFCATCDAPFFRGLEVYVAGGGNAAVTEALYLAGFARSVTLIYPGERLSAPKALLEQASREPKLRLLPHSVVEEAGGEGHEVLDRLVIRDVQTGRLTELRADPADGLLGLFGFLGFRPGTRLFEGQLTMEGGYLVTDEEMRTNLPGVFAAGDLRKKSLRQVVTAAADGAIAAVQAERFLRGRG